MGNKRKNLTYDNNCKIISGKRYSLKSIFLLIAISGVLFVSVHLGQLFLLGWKQEKLNEQIGVLEHDKADLEEAKELTWKNTINNPSYSTFYKRKRIKLVEAIELSEDSLVQARAKLAQNIEKTKSVRSRFYFD